VGCWVSSSASRSSTLATVALTNVLSIDVAWRVSPAVIAISLGPLVTCLLGTLLPAVRAARLDIVAAISVH
jgi:putative ABC transport system permease protein